MTYGCKNRAEFKPHIGQDGWYMDGYTMTPRMVSIPQTMAKTCQYTLGYLGRIDTRCDGCVHKSTEGKKHD